MGDELSPAYLRENLEFSVKLRGYDLEQVDDFVDRVADAIEALQQQIRQTTERAVRAEQLAADNAATDQALRRTLLVAQRTADDVVHEAQAEADRRRAEAQDTARSIIVSAEADAARRASEAQRQLRADIAALEAARDALQADVDALTGHLAAERDRLRRLADGELVAAPVPAASDVVVPPEPVVPESQDEQPVAVEDAIEPIDDVATPVAEDAEPVDVAVPDDPSELDVDESHDDPFLAELRKASDDAAPLGPREDAELFAGFGPLDGEHDLGLDRSRWGRRRRR